MHVACQLDRGDFHVLVPPTAPRQFPDEFCILLRMPLDFTSPQVQEDLQFRVACRGRQGVEISTGHRKATLSVVDSDAWQLLLRANIAGFIELLVVMFLLPDREDVLWVMPARRDTVLVLRAAQTGRTWAGTLAGRGISAGEFSFEHLLEDEMPQREILDQLYKKFRKWAPFDSQFEEDRISSDEHHLTIKIHPELSDFLSFPLSLFISCGYKGFAKYQNEPDWILTEKSVIRNAIERYRIREDMKAFDRFLRGSVIVLNTYAKHYVSGNAQLFRKCLEGTSLVVEVLTLLQRIETYDGPVRLRWYLNPAKEVILQELRSKETLYFFADFEAEEKPGMWQVGEGQRTSHVHCPSSAVPEQNEPECIDCDFAEGELSHIRLMRVFHCHSVYDPYSGDQKPADHHSIVGKLLKAGAWRVEGAMTQETYVAYLCSLLRLFRGNQGFSGILQAMLMGRAGGYEGLTGRIDSYIEMCKE